MYNIFYMFAYELNKDYDKALAYEAEFSKTKKDNEPLDMDELSSPFDKARILYKKGVKKDAFVEYCSADLSYIDKEHEENWRICRGHVEYETFLKNFKEWEQNKITLRGLSGQQWKDKLSCFNDYDAFLQFINEEFEKLGSPEEYAGAVAKYRFLTFDQVWNVE